MSLIQSTCTKCGCSPCCCASSCCQTSGLKVVENSATSCCEPAGSSTCCETVEVKSDSAKKSILTLIGLIFAFALGDYILPSILEGKINENFLFFITHSFGLIGLLGAITTTAVFARSFIDADKVRDHMGKINTIKGHGIAAGIGVATPFCSCSAVPVFTGFVRSGVPVSQAISFLVASPLVNEIAVVMLATWSGWVIAGSYAAAGFAIAVVAGIALKKYAKPELTAILPARTLLGMVDQSGAKIKPSFAARINASVSEAKETISKTWVYVLIGVGAGAAIHGWVPTSAIEKLNSYGPVIGVLVAVLIGMPLYSGIATVIPVISALADKGMPMGTLLAFAMAVTGLSLPEAMLLRSVMKPKLLAIYFATVAVGIIVVGIGFNLVLG